MICLLSSSNPVNKPSYPYFLFVCFWVFIFQWNFPFNLILRWGLSFQYHLSANLLCSFSTDSWFQVGFVLTTGINSAYVLGYSGTIMVPLGWIAGVVGLVAATAISLYANTLIAKLHEFGGKRHIRYRDLAGFVYGMRRYQNNGMIVLTPFSLLLPDGFLLAGRKAYSLTWGLQYVNLFMINVGYIILAGQALKVRSIYVY